VSFEAGGAYRVGRIRRPHFLLFIEYAIVNYMHICLRKVLLVFSSADSGCSEDVGGLVDSVCGTDADVAATDEAFNQH